MQLAPSRQLHRFKIRGSTTSELQLIVKWYYFNGEQPVGGMDRAELEALYTGGVITTNTLVIQEGMYDWIPFRDLKKTTQILPVNNLKLGQEAN